MRDELFAEGVRAIAERHRLPGALARERLGTNIVFAVGADRIVKLFPPLWSGEHAIERAGIAHVAGRLRVATPEIAAEGDLEGWPYLVLTRVAGVPLERVWRGLAPPARERVARRAGELIAEHHALPLPPPGVPAPAWPPFVRERAEIARAKLAADPATGHLARELPAFLEPLLPDLAGPRLVFLNADITEEHLFVASDDPSRIIGLVDLADAMVGAPEYDLVSLAPLLADPARALLGVFLDGAGVPRTARTPALSERLLAWSLLHRYAGADLLGALARATSLSSAARSMFGV